MVEGARSGTARILTGNEAAAEGALAAGCTFYGGYPITPSSEIMEMLARRLPEQGGAFIQMEDELASFSAVIGAAWAGAKAMTATSGPGLSLMMEGIGYAAITETPCVVIDVQRAGPATGQATRVGSGDIIQVRYGSHGDYCPIALSPWSVQEMYDLTIQAFNLAERYRVPTFLLAEESVGHLRENVVLHRDFKIPVRVLAELGYWYSMHRKPAIAEANDVKDRVLVRFAAYGISGPFHGTCLYALRDGEWDCYMIKPSASETISSAETWLDKRNWKEWG